MSVPAGAGQAGDFDPEDQADLAETDLRGETLEAGPIRTRGPRAAEILVDDDELFTPPAEPTRAIGHTVLEADRLRLYSTWRRLD